MRNGTHVSTAREERYRETIKMLCLLSLTQYFGAAHRAYREDTCLLCAGVGRSELNEARCQVDTRRLKRVTDLAEAP